MSDLKLTFKRGRVRCVHATCRIVEKIARGHAVTGMALFVAADKLRRRSGSV